MATRKMDFGESLFTSINQVPDEYNLTHYQTYNVCIEQPPMLISEGIWAGHTVLSAKSTFTMLEIQIITIIFITQCLHFFLQHLGCSYFISQVMVNIPSPLYFFLSNLYHIVYLFLNN
jgi:hypothetical protein